MRFYSVLFLIVQVTALKYELPLARPGEGAAASATSVPLDADHTPGNLRVRVVEADGLGTRADGTGLRALCDRFRRRADAPADEADALAGSRPNGAVGRGLRL